MNKIKLLLLIFIISLCSCGLKQKLNYSSNFVVPDQNFDENSIKLNLDYSCEKNWAFRSDIHDFKKILPKNYSFKNEKKLNVSVFFIHPTTLFSSIKWNADTSHFYNNEIINLCLENQASVFAGITDLYTMQNAFNDDLMQKIDAIKQNTTLKPSIALDENGIPLPIELTDQELEALKQSQKEEDELNEKYADYNPEEDVADSKSILEVVENEELLTYQEAFSELRQLKEKINKEIFLKHSERVQNWESILQWNLITMILDHSYSKKDDFKNNNFFQAIYNNENYSRATEDTVKRQRKIMDLQLDLFWGDIKEIVDRTQKEV